MVARPEQRLLRGTTRIKTTGIGRMRLIVPLYQKACKALNQLTGPKVSISSQQLPSLKLIKPDMMFADKPLEHEHSH